MRDIKFRAWDTTYKYMNYKVIVGMWGNDVLNDENYTSCAMWIKPENVDYKCEPHWGHFEPYHKSVKLMQYTGLKDANGKEIYEGDIVKNEYNKIGYVVFLQQEMGYVVVYKNSDSRLGRRNTGSLYDIDLSLEVIGNVYENECLITF